MTISQERPRAAAAKGRVNAQAGFSFVELLVVLSIIVIMSTYAVFTMRAQRNAFRTDDQGRRILDYIRDASQRALVQRQMMRMEIDLNTSVMRIIDENGAGTTDDVIVRREGLLSPTEVRTVRTVFALNGPPLGVVAPPAPSNYPAAVYAASTHPLSMNNTVCLMRFRPDGAVVDNANNVVSLTLYLWEPAAGNLDAPNEPRRVRAITVFGGTGGVRLWKYNGAAFVVR